MSRPTLPLWPVQSVSVSLHCISLAACMQHKTRTIQNLRPLGPVSGETLSQSEIDFYIDGVRVGCRSVCTVHELFILAIHLPFTILCCHIHVLYGRKFWQIAQNTSFGVIYFGGQASLSHNDIHNKMAIRTRWELNRVVS